MKELVIIAGANGSGKSTLASQLKFAGEFINADKVAKKYSCDEEQAVLLVARAIQTSIKAGNSFAFETVFSTTEIPTFLKTAKQNGYKIILHYIATETPDINIARVAKRVNQGGHDVPKQKIIERYGKSLAILPALLDLADEATLYDNSSEKYRPFLVKENNQIETIDTLPQWAQKIGY